MVKDECLGAVQNLTLIIILAFPNITSFLCLFLVNENARISHHLTTGAKRTAALLTHVRGYLGSLKLTEDYSSCKVDIVEADLRIGQCVV